MVIYCSFVARALIAVAVAMIVMLDAVRIIQVGAPRVALTIVIVAAIIMSQVSMLCASRLWCRASASW